MEPASSLQRHRVESRPLPWVIASVVLIATILIVVTPASSDPWTFVFSGTFDFNNLPGGELDFELMITVDDGGQTPEGLFYPEHWKRYELVSGSYVQIWDPNAGGIFSGCSMGSTENCLRIQSDGVNAHLFICSGYDELDMASMCGAQDNLAPPAEEVCLSAHCLSMFGGSSFTVDSIPYGGAMISRGPHAPIVLNGVVSGQPPDCSMAHPSVFELWPPNHKMVEVGVEGVVDPEGGPVNIAITGVTSDEPVHALGEGDTCPDAILNGSFALLRAERAGGGNGRVYTVHFTATDPTGLSYVDSVEVCVPHDRRKWGSCTKDDLMTADATSCTSEEPSLGASGNAKLWLSQGSGTGVGVGFALAASAPVEVAIYDPRGRRVRLLVRGEYAAGNHTVRWNGRDSNGREVAAGVYLVRLAAGGGVHTIKTTWVRK